jgi:hypothetical protein
MDDYVKCVQCDAGNPKEVVYQCLQLPVIGEEQETAYESANEALVAYLREEVMTDGEPYFCTNCDRIRERRKSIQLKSIPYLPYVQFEIRFLFYRITQKRYKINDFISFDQKWHLGRFVDSGELINCPIIN